MTAVTDTRKRSRDEDNCDFMPISKRINNLSITNQHHIFNSHDSNELPAAGLYINGNGMHHEEPLHAAYYTEQMHNANRILHQTGAAETCNPMYEQQQQHHQQHHHNHHHHQQQHQSPHISNNGAPHRYFAMNSHENNDSHLGVPSINGRLHQTIIQHQHSHQHQHQPDNLNAIDMESYSPELTATENPFYYNKNKLLFDLHIERERRNQQANH